LILPPFRKERGRMGHSGICGGREKLRVPSAPLRTGSSTARYALRATLRMTVLVRFEGLVKLRLRFPFAMLRVRMTFVAGMTIVA
jgi:hypothetical protein